MNAHTIFYGERLILRGIPREYKTFQFVLCGMPKGNPAFPFSYIAESGSVRGAGALKQEMVLLQTLLDGSGKTLVCTRAPLSPDVIADLGLIPIRTVLAESFGQFILDYCRERGQPAVELVNDDGRVALIHPSTKFAGKYQLTYFDKLGPYLDTTDKNPAQMAIEAHYSGYRRIIPGILDEMVKGFLKVS